MSINVNKNYFGNLFIVTLVFSAKLQQVANAQANYLKITSYKVYYGWATQYPQDWMIIRQFENDGKSYYLLVNPEALETRSTNRVFIRLNR